LFIDKFGNKTAMRFAIILGGINPLIWLLASPETYWIIYFEAVLSGIMWSGTNIVALNFVLAIAPTKRRQVYSGVYGAFTGVAMMTTMLLSGAFLPGAMDIGTLHLEPGQVLFGLTGLARLTAGIPLTWMENGNRFWCAILSYISAISPRSGSPGLQEFSTAGQGRFYLAPPSRIEYF